MTGRALVVQADAQRLPLPDGCVDLVVTSPPYFALRAYATEGHPAEVGSEAHWRDWLARLVEATAEMARVLKPSGSIFVNLGDKYAGTPNGNTAADTWMTGDSPGRAQSIAIRQAAAKRRISYGVPNKSLLLLPERYRIACVDQLGLTARAVIVWDKPNGLPESVTDRVRRSHEDWVHLTRQGRYYAAADELREPHTTALPVVDKGARTSNHVRERGTVTGADPWGSLGYNSLGKLPGSVWQIPSEPLRLPQWLGVEHYACVDTETEVLTQRGWLRYGDLHEGDTVAGYDLTTGLAEWTSCLGVSAYEYDGDLISVEKDRLSMRLTPNHRCVVARTDGNDKHRGPPEIVRADALSRRCAVPRSAEWKDDGGTEDIGEVLAAVCGWVASEGYYTSEGYVHLTQSLTVNPEKVRAIDDLLAGLPNIAYDLGAMNIYRSGPKWRARSKIGGVDRGASFHTLEEAQAWVRGVRDARGLDGLQRVERRADYKGREVIDVVWRLPRGVAQRIRELMPDKHLTQQLANLPASEARALLEAFIEGDGHRHVRGTAITIFQKHRRSLDWLQIIAVRLGYRTSIKPARNGYVLHLHPSQRFLTLRSANPSGAIRREHYRGLVWCPTTGTGTLIARRNGSVFITGNSFPSEWPRRLVLGWSPPGVCVVCGEGRVPVVDRQVTLPKNAHDRPDASRTVDGDMTLILRGGNPGSTLRQGREATILGYACSCCPSTLHPGTGDSERGGQPWGGNAFPGQPRQDQSGGLGNMPRTGPWREYHLSGWQAPPTRPALVLDPFCGTGTTLGVARALGRHAIGVDLSHSYCRSANYRVFQSGDFGKAEARTWRARQGTLL